jgi:hypothetical protein
VPKVKDTEPKNTVKPTKAEDFCCWLTVLTFEEKL